MKRLFLIILLALLPLQTGWAAGWCVISDEASATAAVSDVTGAENPIEVLFDAGCSATCVSACDLQPLGSGASVIEWSGQSRSCPASLSQLNYQSPVLDGPIRPKWL